MKLNRLVIHNFRSIRDADINVADYCLLVGANNAGKTTIVDCIRAAYEKDKYRYTKSRDFPRGEGLADQESWVDLEFTLTAPEFQSLAEKYQLPENRLRVRKVFLTEDKALKEGTIYGYTSEDEFEKSAFYGAKGVQNGKLGELIYVPAVSTVDEHTKLSGPSALRDLLSDMLGSVIEGSQEYATFSGHYGGFVQAIKAAENNDQNSLSKFEHELDQSLSGWKAGFQINFRPPSAQDLVKSLIGWDLMDQITNQESSAGNFGSGFQRYFIFSLITIGAKYANTKAPAKDKDFQPNLTLLLFEEPEAFLHPPQQVTLSNELHTLASTEGWQVLCTTHSPHFVSRRMTDISSLIRLRGGNGISQAYQITQSAYDELLEARGQLEEIVGGPQGLSTLEADQLEMLRYFLWLNPERSGLFFSELVILVEGLTEVALFNRLIDDGVLPAGGTQCYILNCEGKYNIHRFMKLLTMLGVPHIVLHDEDGEGNGHPKINQLIQDSSDAELTLGIEVLPHDLEKHLGMPEIKRSQNRLKPLLAIQRYESNQYEAAPLHDLCQRIAVYMG